MSQHEIASTAGGATQLPIGGLVTLGAGATLWLGSTAVKVLAAAGAPPAPMAMADPSVSVTITSVDWASVGQCLSGVLFLASMLVSWVLGRRKQIDDYSRDRRVADAIADLRIEMERHGIHVDGRFEKQDVVLKSIADTQASASQSTPISINVSPGSPATSQPKESQPIA